MARVSIISPRYACNPCLHGMVLAVLVALVVMVVMVVMIVLVLVVLVAMLPLLTSVTRNLTRVTSRDWIHSILFLQHVPVGLMECRAAPCRAARTRTRTRTRDSIQEVSDPDNVLGRWMHVQFAVHAVLCWRIHDRRSTVRTVRWRCGGVLWM